MTLKQKFMDLSAAPFPPPVGFVRNDQHCISREVRGGDASHWAVITDEGEDGFRLVHPDCGGLVEYNGLPLDEAVKIARQSFRAAGVDDGVRYYLPTVLPSIARKARPGEDDAREFTPCVKCLGEGECQQKYGATPAFPREDGDCVWRNCNAEMDSWDFQPRIVGASVGAI